MEITIWLEWESLDVVGMRMTWCDWNGNHILTWLD